MKQIASIIVLLAASNIGAMQQAAEQNAGVPPAKLDILNEKSILCPIDQEVLNKCKDPRFATQMQPIIKEAQELNTLFSRALEWYLYAVTTQNSNNIYQYLTACMEQTAKKIDLSDAAIPHDKNDAQTSNSKYRAQTLCKVVEARLTLQENLDALRLALSLAKRAELRPEKEKNEQFLKQLENN